MMAAFVPNLAAMPHFGRERSGDRIGGTVNLRNVVSVRYRRTVKEVLLQGALAH